jgi:hypothetical protein
MLETYYEILPRVLLAFQHLEEILREYLIRCEFMTAARLQSITEYRIPKNGFDKFSLGNLIDRFEKFNANDDLISRLKSIVSERNFVAHESYVACYENGEPKRADEIEILYERILKAKENTTKCFNDIIQETKGLEERFVKIQRSTNQ